MFCVSKYVNNFMKTILPLSAIYLEKRRINIDNRFSIKLRITFKRERRYYATGYHANLKEWKIINSDKAQGKLKDLKKRLFTIEQTAEKCIENAFPFSFKKFEELFFIKEGEKITLQSVFDDYIRKLKNNNRVGTSIAYKNALISLQKFKPDIDFSHLTSEFLNDYENWMLSKGKSITTVGMYLRALRAIYNIGIDKKIVSNKDYPFGKKKYVVPSGRNIKKALSIEEVSEIFTYETTLLSPADRAKDFWIFSYLCNGINMKDIALLKWKNITTETICFEREKTKNSTRTQPVKIVALRNDYINVIIKKWGNPPSLNLDDFVFKILETMDTPFRQREKVNLFIKNVNKYMKEMGKDLKFDLTLTTYVARHSFATILIQNGAPLEFASQSLGHTNITTTQRYFAGFDLEAQKEFTKVLTKFN